MFDIQNKDSSRDLHNMIHIIRKHIELIITVFIIAVVATTALSFLIPPTYEGEATLRIKPSKSLDNSLLTDVSASDIEIQKMLATYAEIIRGRTVIDMVIAKAHLPKVSYEKMLTRIRIEAVKNSEILKVKVRDHNAAKAMLLTNTLVENFLVRLGKLMRSEESAVGDFIDRYLVGAKQNLDQAEQALENFKKEKRIAAPEDETKALVERLSSMNRLQAENRITLAAAKAKLAAAAKELSREKNQSTPDSSLIREYKGKLANLEVELVGLLHSYGEESPIVADARSEIEDLRTKLNTEINKTVNSGETSANPAYQNLVQGKMQAGVDIATANAQGVALSQLTAEAEREIGALPAREQKLARLMRDVSFAQEIYVMLTKRREETRISELMIPTNIQFIDRAVLPDKPVFPNKALSVLAAAFLGLMLGLSLAFLLEYWNNTIDTADDVREHLNLPVLGNIPDFNQHCKGARPY